VHCSERSGKLKPDPVSFLELARMMGKAPEEILYVGNSVSYDVGGALCAGMKSALIVPRWKRRSGLTLPAFVFHDYRQLCDYVLS
jgi:putative hydrolase of the HAD superfamily